MTKILLYSGGLDSWLINKLWKPDIKLYINSSYSNEKILKLAKDVKIIKSPLGQFEDKETKFVPLKSLYFLMIASNYGDNLCLRATAEDCGRMNKRQEFLDMTDNIINYCIKLLKLKSDLIIVKI